MRTILIVLGAFGLVVAGAALVLLTPLGDVNASQQLTIATATLSSPVIEESQPAVAGATTAVVSRTTSTAPVQQVAVSLEGWDIDEIFPIFDYKLSRRLPGLKKTMRATDTFTITGTVEKVVDAPFATYGDEHAGRYVLFVEPTDKTYAYNTWGIRHPGLGPYEGSIMPQFSAKFPLDSTVMSGLKPGTEVTVVCHGLNHQPMESWIFPCSDLR